MIRINLLPPEHKPQPSVRPLRLLVLFLLIVAPMGLVGGGFWGWNHLQSIRQQIEEAKEKRAEYGPVYDEVVGLEKSLADLEKKVQARDQLMGGLLDSAWILRSMEELIPHNVVYSSFRVGADGSVSVSGSSLDYYGVAALNLKLSLDPRCSDVSLQSASQKDENAVGFSASFTLQKGAQSP